MRSLNKILLHALLFIAVGSAAAAAPDNSATQRLHLDWLDRSVKPTDNFFKFANGTWQKQNPIPAAYPSWGAFEILRRHTQQNIRNILETAAHNPKNPPGSDAQKVGDFYFSGMDEATINKLGATPLQPEFDRINNIQNLTDLQQTITHLQLIGVEALFDFGQMQDFKDSNKVIAVASQGGLGLPDRDYYLKNDAKFQKIRQLYVNHIANMFKLLGDDPIKASAEANTVMSIETTLAKASMSLIAQRDPRAVYHPMDLTQIQQTTPGFLWQRYLSELGHPEINNINLAMPDFFKVMNTQLQNVPLADWKTYLRWHLIDAMAPYLSKPFVDQNFKMTSVLSGAKELLPRWQRVVNAENQALGFAVGKLYVAKYFPPSSKTAALEILHNIRNALKNDLQTLAWMTPQTRAAALKKLSMMEDRIGYPDQWWNYSTLTIDRGAYVLNVMRAVEFFQRRELNKIGKPIDMKDWDIPPQTVNAFYNPSQNSLNIPAGILQPPFFDPKASMAMNYGALGFVMGHEMTHGFDDQGAQFDGHGNLKNWWSPADMQKFKVATQCISDHFSQYVVDGDLHVQGKLVTGEATADLGGLILAFRAFHASPAYKDAKTIDGFTPDQQFFLGAAHVWASNMRPEAERNQVITDPHPPAMYRVNGALANMPQFKLAFNLGNDSQMVNQQQCVIW